jgi:hypothetical protein
MVIAVTWNSSLYGCVPLQKVSPTVRRIAGRLTNADHTTRTGDVNAFKSQTGIDAMASSQVNIF